VSDKPPSSALGKCSELFWAGIERLKAMEIKGSRLVTFMCDSVASALGKCRDRLIELQSDALQSEC
jgi:hypothetical protein